MAEELHKITPEELMKLYSDKSSFVLLAFSYLHDRDVAEDIFQESVLYILENRDTITVANARWYFSRVILNNCLLWHTIFSLTRKSRDCHIRISLRLIMLPSAAWRRRCSVPLLSSGASSRIIGSFSSWFSAKGSIDLHPFEVLCEGCDIP